MKSVFRQFFLFNIIGLSLQAGIVFGETIRSSSGNDCMHERTKPNNNFSRATAAARYKTLLNMAVFVLLLLETGVLSPVAANEPEPNGFLPPYELIKNNVETTDVTVAIQIMDAEEEHAIRSDDGVPGYNVYRISARIIRCYKGTVREGEVIAYHWCIEAGIKVPPNGTKHIVSLNKKKGRLVVPDVGYHFGYSKRLDELFERAAKESGVLPDP